MSEAERNPHLTTKKMTIKIACTLNLKTAKKMLLFCAVKTLLLSKATKIMSYT